MMPSPFPGVDPHLEDQGLWADFHSKFINCWQELLLDSLPGGYDARLAEHVYIVHDQVEPGKLIIPDVALEQLPDAGNGGGVAAVESALATTTVTLPVSYEVHESYIRIQKHPERTLVAVLELLSPTNKGSERAVYLKKRDEIIASTVHLVEVDLLLCGQRLPVCDKLPPAHYYAYVARGDNRPRCDVAHWGIRHALPKIAVPLAEPGAHVLSDLGEVFRIAWERGRYERAIDYTRPLELPFHEQDLQWIQQQLTRGREQVSASAAAETDPNRKQT